MKRTNVFWTKDEDEILLNTINLEGRKNWKFISTLLKNKTPIQCFYRFRKINPSMLRTKWTEDEDIELQRLFDLNKNNWSKIAKIMKTRGPKQIRDRYINNLDPKIKRGYFKISEDLKILKLKNLVGNKWSLISKYFENRSPDIIKSRYYSSIKNKKELLFFLDSLDNSEEKNSGCCSNIFSDRNSNSNLSTDNLQSLNLEDENKNFVSSKSFYCIESSELNFSNNSCKFGKYSDIMYEPQEDLNVNAESD